MSIIEAVHRAFDQAFNANLDIRAALGEKGIDIPRSVANDFIRNLARLGYVVKEG